MVKAVHLESRDGAHAPILPLIISGLTLGKSLHASEPQLCTITLGFSRLRSQGRKSSQ